MRHAAAHERILILVAEDDPVLSEELRHGLEAEGFAVMEAADAPAVFAALEQHSVGLVTLDLGLGPADGLALAPRIRAARNVPIVIITGRNSPTDRLAGLEHGADDYITKPFHIREAAIRIRSVLARYETDAHAMPPERLGAERLPFDDSVLDVRNRRIEHADGGRTALTETEFSILLLLLTHPGRVFSRDDLSLAVTRRRWSPFDRTIDGHMARLRRKLGERREERLIRSVRGVGYVFVGDAAGSAPSQDSRRQPVATEAG
jgi:two-component system phosphate regulon response regulator OmpR